MKKGKIIIIAACTVTAALLIGYTIISSKILNRESNYCLILPYKPGTKSTEFVDIQGASNAIKINSDGTKKVLKDVKINNFCYTYAKSKYGLDVPRLILFHNERKRQHGVMNAITGKNIVISKNKTYGNGNDYIIGMNNNLYQNIYDSEGKLIYTYKSREFSSGWGMIRDYKYAAGIWNDKKKKLTFIYPNGDVKEFSYKKFHKLHLIDLCGKEIILVVCENKAAACTVDGKMICSSINNSKPITRTNSHEKLYRNDKLMLISGYKAHKKYTQKLYDTFTGDLLDEQDVTNPSDTKIIPKIKEIIAANLTGNILTFKLNKKTIKQKIENKNLIIKRVSPSKIGNFIVITVELAAKKNYKKLIYYVYSINNGKFIYTVTMPTNRPAAKDKSSYLYTYEKMVE